MISLAALNSPTELRLLLVNISGEENNHGKKGFAL